MTDKARYTPEVWQEINRAARQGEEHATDHIIALIENQICFDAQADSDGRCAHHGGKCYELRQLINKLKNGG
jgi:hypothetical protein